MRINVLVVLAVLMTQSLAFADAKQTRKERYDRVASEWEKFETHNENVCIGEGYIVLSYGVYDRKEFRPVLFPASLPQDLLATLATRLGTFKDPELQEALAGPFNAALNEKIESLRNGRYNQITVRVKKGFGFWVTPSESEADALLVWIPLGAFSALRYIAGGEKPSSPVYVLSPDGSFMPMDGKQRPAWFQGNNIYEASGGNLSSERKRAKLLTKCN
jgi:hypothetical protein